jgi:hypothetical protein
MRKYRKLLFAAERIELTVAIQNEKNYNNNACTTVNQERIITLQGAEYHPIL